MTDISAAAREDGARWVAARRDPVHFRVLYFGFTELTKFFRFPKQCVGASQFFFVATNLPILMYSFNDIRSASNEDSNL